MALSEVDVLCSLHANRKTPSLPVNVLPSEHSRDGSLGPEPSIENWSWGRVWSWALRASALNDPMRLYPAVQLAVSLPVAMPVLSGRPDLCSHFLATQKHGHRVFSQAPPNAVNAVRGGSCLPPPQTKTQNKAYNFGLTASTTWQCVDYMQGRCSILHSCSVGFRPVATQDGKA